MIFRRRRIRVELDYTSLHMAGSPSASPPRDVERSSVGPDVKASPAPEPRALLINPDLSADLASGTLIQNRGKEKNQ